MDRPERRQCQPGRHDNPSRCADRRRAEPLGQAVRDPAGNRDRQGPAGHHQPRAERAVTENLLEMERQRQESRGLPRKAADRSHNRYPKPTLAQQIERPLRCWARPLSPAQDRGTGDRCGCKRCRNNGTVCCHGRCRPNQSRGRSMQRNAGQIDRTPDRFDAGQGNRGGKRERSDRQLDEEQPGPGGERKDDRPRDRPSRRAERDGHRVPADHCTKPLRAEGEPQQRDPSDMIAAPPSPCSPRTTRPSIPNRGERRSPPGFAEASPRWIEPRQSPSGPK